VWLYAAGGWLILAGLAHTTAHVWNVVLENGMGGQREFAMNAMKQAFSTEPLQPSMWRTFRALSVSYGLLLVLAGGVDVALAVSEAGGRVVRAVTLLATVFWTVAFVPHAFVDPVAGPLVVALVAVPLHGIAFLTASEDVNG
jgi:hypothetical protein